MPTHTDEMTVLRYVVKYHKANGMVPTVREIRDQFGWAGTAPAVLRLQKLIRKGYLTSANGRARAHVLTEAGKRAGRVT